MTTWMLDTPDSRGRILGGRGQRTESPNQAKKHFAYVAPLVSKSDFLVSISLLLVSKSDFLASISLLLVSKSDFLASISLLLVSKSDFLASISLLLVSKSDFLVSVSLLLVSKGDFLVADELASFSEDLSTLRRNPSLAKRDGPPAASLQL